VSQVLPKEKLNIEVGIEGMDRLLDEYPLQGILIVDEHERIIHANSYFLNYTGYTENQLSCLSFAQVVQIKDSLSHTYIRYFGRKPAESQEAPTAVILTSNGELKARAFSMITLLQEKRLLYLIVFETHEEQLQLSLLQRFSDAFLKDVNLGVILMDVHFSLVDISDMACRVLGLVRTEIIQKPMIEIFASVPIEHQLVQKTILDGMVTRNHAISWMNGQDRYELLLDSNVLRDNQGEIVGAYLIFKDVTNLRSLEEMVQRSDRLAMIGQIAAGTAHEIRNPLTSIKGFLQVLRRTFEGHNMLKERGYTEVMLTEIDRINELVNEFLMLSKPKHVSYEQTDVSHVLREILPIINNEAILYKVHLQYEAAYRMPKVIADQEMLKQVFLNICKNGIEAMVDGGTLTITEKLDTEERKVSIEIHDTGPGIPVFVIDKIFDPFFTTKDSGTGLGLSVCQRIIHDMGGNIRVASKGFGTTFTVSIPYA
jgi:two-component system, sporulation sensor kinase E